MAKDSQPTPPNIKTSQLVKKPTGKRIGASAITKAQVKKQPTVKKSRLGGCLATLGAIATLLAIGGVAVGGIWLAILLMVNPNAIVWLNQYLPEWTRIPIASTSPPKTLSTIQDEIRKSGLIPGDLLPLKDSELLLPIFALSPHCQSDCEKIVELRAYQAAKSSGDQKYYQLVSQLPISGPQEYFVLSTAVGTKGNPTLSRSLPLTKLSPFDDKAPTIGFWFMLSGQRLSGDTPITYGQVIHYNPDQMHLSVMVQWTSPNELQPSWQQVTGTTTPELVVNQTAGLEPKVQVFQIKPRQFVPDPIYLEEISLAQPAIDTQVFRNALMLSRSGLWSPARQLLQSQKKNKWPALAQAQLDVIQLHAQVTESQATQSWASPSQQIFANLLDGRWADALLMFQSSESGLPVQEIATMLNADSGGLWGRVEAALKVNPKDNNVKAWGALIMAAQQGRPKAIAWLKQLQKNKPAQPDNNTQINELLDHLEDTEGIGSLNGSRLSQIIGDARQVVNVNTADWLQLEQNPTSKKALPLKREPQQVWYQVQIAAFNDGQRWRQMPFTNLKLPKNFQAKQLWKYLGLDADSQIQIIVWTADGQQESRTATVKAVSYRGGVIQLLAAGEPLPAPTPGAGSRSRPLAYTDTALTWLEPPAVTLSDLNQVQPKLVSVLFPALWQELVQSGHLKSGTKPSLQVMLRDMGYWSARLVELTGNNEPEVVLTLYEDRSGGLKKLDIARTLENSQQYKPRTLIFADKGTLLYSEFSKDAGGSLNAIADLRDGGSAALVIDNKSNYTLKRWSRERKRFE